MACNKTKYVGRDVVLEYAIGCGEVMPTEAEWKVFGSLRTKEFNLAWDTTDATDSDSIGALRENLATFQTLTISGDGTCKASGAGAANLIELTKHVANPVATSGQPVAWMRMTFPDLTFTAYMIISTMSRSAPYDDVVTYSMEATATASDYGLMVDDTPSEDADDVASVSVYVGSSNLAVGAKDQCAAIVSPTTAPSAVVWTVDDQAIATVDQNGIVTGVSSGDVVVKATSKYDNTKFGSVTITVA